MIRLSYLVIALAADVLVMLGTKVSADMVLLVDILEYSRKKWLTLFIT